jgi:hypothetical protein
MRKYVYELGAGAAIVIGIIPICIFAGMYSACLAILMKLLKYFPYTKSAI